jgi:hypothetical protein
MKEQGALLDLLDDVSKDDRFSPKQKIQVESLISEVHRPTRKRKTLITSLQNSFIDSEEEEREAALKKRRLNEAVDVDYAPPLADDMDVDLNVGDDEPFTVGNDKNASAAAEAKSEESFRFRKFSLVKATVLLPEPHRTRLAQMDGTRIHQFGTMYRKIWEGILGKPGTMVPPIDLTTLVASHSPSRPSFSTSFGVPPPPAASANAIASTSTSVAQRMSSIQAVAGTSAKVAANSVISATTIASVSPTSTARKVLPSFALPLVSTSPSPAGDQRVASSTALVTSTSLATLNSSTVPSRQPMSSFRSLQSQSKLSSQTATLSSLPRSFSREVSVQKAFDFINERTEIPTRKHDKPQLRLKRAARPSSPLSASEQEEANRFEVSESNRSSTNQTPSKPLNSSTSAANASNSGKNSNENTSASEGSRGVGRPRKYHRIEREVLIGFVPK